MRRLITGDISSRLFAGQFLLALFFIGNLKKGKSSRERGNKTCREETTLPSTQESPTLPSTIVLLLAYRSYLSDSNHTQQFHHSRPRGEISVTSVCQGLRSPRNVRIFAQRRLLFPPLLLFGFLSWKSCCVFASTFLPRLFSIVDYIRYSIRCSIIRKGRCFYKLFDHELTRVLCVRFARSYPRRFVEN